MDEYLAYLSQFNSYNSSTSHYVSRNDDYKRSTNNNSYNKKRRPEKKEYKDYDDPDNQAPTNIKGIISYEDLDI